MPSMTDSNATGSNSTPSPEPGTQSNASGTNGVDTMRFARCVAIFICGILLILATAALTTYFWKFADRRLSDDAQDWGVFGDYVGGVLNPIVALINMIAFTYIAYSINRLETSHAKKLHEAQEKDKKEREYSERRLNAMHLVDNVYSPQTYKEIAAPVWEIFVKWRYWKGIQGDQYRLSVVTGFVSFASHYTDFELPSELRMSGHNVIRFGDHYHASDYPSAHGRPGYVQSVLSEHQALNCWLEFWSNVQAMIEIQLADKETVRDLLSVWYMYWLDFMLELRHVVRTLCQEKRSQSDLEHDPLPEPEPRWIKKLDDLEKLFFGDPAHSPIKKYPLRTERCRASADEILAALRPLLSESARHASENATVN